MDWTGIGLLNIRTPETRETPNFIGILLQPDEDEMLAVWSMDVHVFRFNHSIPYVNILRKWSRFCISYDFEENQAQVKSDERNKMNFFMVHIYSNQVSINGLVSDLVKNPESDPNFNGTFDAQKISKAPPNSDLFLSFGLYDYDKNPFIGQMININVWDRTMKSDGEYLK